MGERSARHRRDRSGTTGSADDDDLPALARHRLQRVLGDPMPAATPPSGWVPERPSPHGPAASPASFGPRPASPGRFPALADRLPVRLRVAVVAPAGRAVVALLGLVLVAVVAAAVTTWLARPREVPAPGRARLVGAPLSSGGSALPATGSPGTAGTSTAAPAASGIGLVVHVVGAVRHPGVVELPTGSRVADAVEAVGGLTRRGDPASVNLARPAVDGEQVVVARRGTADTVGTVGTAPPPVAGAPGTSAGGAVASPAATVDLNTATLEQLDGLPGIGPVLAQRILDWRAANGRFSTVEELGEVSGIGEATLGDLRPLVTV